MMEDDVMWTNRTLKAFCGFCQQLDEIPVWKIHGFAKSMPVIHRLWKSEFTC